MILQRSASKKKSKQKMCSIEISYKNRGNELIRSKELVQPSLFCWKRDNDQDGTTQESFFTCLKSKEKPAQNSLNLILEICS